MPLTLTINVKREENSRELTFDGRCQRTIKIGGNKKAQVRVDDPGVGRLHAVIELTNAAAYFTDLGSIEGTLLNGKRVRRTELRDGDVLGIGQTSLHVWLTPTQRVAADQLVDKTLHCRRGVGRDWLATDYVSKEKYDTRHLIGQMTRDRRRGSGVGAAALFAAAIAVGAVPISLTRGTSLPSVPEVSIPAIRPSPPGMVQPAERTYVVRPNDTLGKIAKRELGGVKKWRVIWTANREQLPDPSSLDVGMRLVIP
ncbi:FHA domain-containing protein [Myxococcota bacterium]